MKKLFLIAGLAFAFASCGNKSDEKAMTPEEETKFATEEVQAIDSSVNEVVTSVDEKEAKVDELLKGI
jgi:peptidoglycan hydrolase CwlO-like protein